MVLTLVTENGTKNEVVRISAWTKQELEELTFELKIKYPGDVIEYLIRKHKGLSTDDLVVKNGNGNSNDEPTKLEPI